MKERYEFRLPDKEARSLLRSSIEHFPILSGKTRVVKVQPADDLFEEIREAELQRHTEGGLFYSWDVRRTYQRGELEGAELVHLIPTGASSPSARIAARSTTSPPPVPIAVRAESRPHHLPLIFGVTSPTTTFDTTILRRGKDVALSIAGEIVVSDRLSRLFQTAEVSGFELRPVHKCDTNVPIADWYQLRVCRSAGREDPTDAVSARTEGLLMLKVFSEAG